MIDLNYLQKEILNKQARKKGHVNWESMKLCIEEHKAKFIEEIVLSAIKHTWEVRIGQQTLDKY